jgi:hypothetical protein
MTDDDVLDCDTSAHLHLLLRLLGEADPSELEAVRDLMTAAVERWHDQGGTFDSRVQQILVCFRQLASMRARELRRGESLVAEFERFLAAQPPEEKPD